MNTMIRLIATMTGVSCDKASSMIAWNPFALNIRNLALITSQESIYMQKPILTRNKWLQGEDMKIKAAPTTTTCPPEQTRPRSELLALKQTKLSPLAICMSRFASQNCQCGLEPKDPENIKYYISWVAWVQRLIPTGVVALTTTLSIVESRFRLRL